MKEGKKRTKITAYITEEEKEIIEKYAKIENRSATNFVYNIITEYIKEQEKRTKV